MGGIQQEYCTNMGEYGGLWGNMGEYGGNMGVFSYCFPSVLVY